MRKKDAIEKVKADKKRELLQQTVTHNCQMLDFFFSARVGFSLEALREKTRPCQDFHLVSLASVALVLT